MYLSTILDVLWARRLIVLAAVLACMAGGLTVILISPARYQASARVVLDYIKPDPVTGAQVPSKMVDAYVNSQLQFIRDYQVAIPAAESLGMLDSPDLSDAYAALPPGPNKPDFPTWVASHLIPYIDAVPIEDSNIIEIRYRAYSPAAARDVVEALRSAYVDATLNQRRGEAQAGAAALARQLEVAKQKLSEVQSRQTELEKQSGVMLNKTHEDLDDARLRRLARSVRYLGVGPQTAANTGNSAKLALAEADLESQSRALGPNNPKLSALKATVSQLKEIVASERDGREEAADTIISQTRADEEALENQKTKVLNERQAVMRVRLLQDEINHYTGQVNGLAKGIAQFHQLETLKETNITPIGPATAMPDPVFPNPPLILVGSGALGLTLGALLAFFTEMLARRVRIARDLEIACGAPLLGSVPQISRPSWLSARQIETNKAGLALSAQRKLAA